MGKDYISATELKKNVSEILNNVYFKKSITTVERYGKPIAKIIPLDEGTNKTAPLDRILNKYFGILPDFPRIAKERKFRQRRNLNEISR